MEIQKLFRSIIQLKTTKTFHKFCLEASSIPGHGYGEGGAAKDCGARQPTLRGLAGVNGCARTTSAWK
jgi:hypothetical protein